MTKQNSFVIVSNDVSVRQLFMRRTEPKDELNILLLFTPVSITPLIDTEDACFDLNASRSIANGDLKWRDALLVAHRVNSNNIFREGVVRMKM